MKIKDGFTTSTSRAAACSTFKAFGLHAGLGSGPKNGYTMYL